MERTDSIMTRNVCPMFPGEKKKKNEGNEKKTTICEIQMSQLFI